MSRLNKLLKGHVSMTFRLAFGASYSTIVFTVKILLVNKVEWNPQSPTTVSYYGKSHQEQNDMFFFSVVMSHEGDISLYFSPNNILGADSQ